MNEVLPALAFGLVIGAQFLAVIAMHELEPNKCASSADSRQRVVASAAASGERI